MANTSSQQAIPSTTQPFVDPTMGTIQYPWYRLLLTLWNRTGGPGGDTSGAPAVVDDVNGTTLTASELNAVTILRSGPGTAFTDTVDNANNYILAKNYPLVGNTSNNVFVNLTAFPWTIQPVSSVTFSGNLVNGNFVVAPNSQRTFIIEITSIANPAITIHG
jgi:hypothetical protein